MWICRNPDLLGSAVQEPKPFIFLTVMSNLMRIATLNKVLVICIMAF